MWILVQVLLIISKILLLDMMHHFSSWPKIILTFHAGKNGKKSKTKDVLAPSEESEMKTLITEKIVVP